MKMRAITTLAIVTVLAISAALTMPLGKSDVAKDADALLRSGHKRYGVESGIIKYKVSGTHNGTETVYFDKWGLREAKYTNIELELMGVKQKTNTITIIDGEIMYSVDADKNTASKMENAMFSKLTSGYDTKHLGEAGRKMVESMGGKKTGSESVLGKQCEVWEISSTKAKTWVWNYITLKMEVEIMGTGMQMEATDFEENAKIPADKMQLPEGVQISLTPNAKVKMPGQLKK